MAKRILVIEDDRDSRETFCEVLRLAGFECVSAHDGAEGLGVLLGDLPVDAILLDLMMPKLDGWQFRKQQLANPTFAKIPVIVVSALAVARKSAPTFGASAFLAKPVAAEDLVAAFRRVAPGPDAAAEAVAIDASAAARGPEPPVVH